MVLLPPREISFGGSFERLLLADFVAEDGCELLRSNDSVGVTLDSASAEAAMMGRSSQD
jgi:hypothetical protein